MNSVNSLGVTPLHDAVVRGDIHVIEELLRAGANPCIRAIKGYSFFNIYLINSFSMSLLFFIFCAVQRKFGGKTAFELASQKPSLELIITKLTAFETAPKFDGVSTSTVISGDGNNCSHNTDQVPHLRHNIPTCHNNRKLSSR